MCPGTPVADDEVGLSMTIIGSDQRSCRRPTCCTLSLPLAAGIVGSPHTPRLDPRRTHGTRAVGTGIPDGLISWGLESHTRGHAFGTPSLGTERRHVPDPALPSLEYTALNDLQPTLCMIGMSERSKSSYRRLRDNLRGWAVCLRPSEKQVGDSLRPGSNQVGDKGRRQSVTGT